jgi:hypothetical protein
LKCYINLLQFRIKYLLESISVGGHLYPDVPMNLCYFCKHNIQVVFTIKGTQKFVYIHVATELKANL